MQKNKIFIGDVFDFLEKLPDSCIDLAIIDPPYNLTKNILQFITKICNIF